MLRPSRKTKRRIFNTLSINNTCSSSARVCANVNETGGSILNDDYPPKWVNFACRFTVKGLLGELQFLSHSETVEGRLDGNSCYEPVSRIKTFGYYPLGIRL